MSKPKLGVLALTLDFYETLVPTLRGEREAWLRDKALAAFPDSVNLEFGAAVFTRPTIDAEVARLEAAGCDGLMVVLLTYSPSQLALPALSRTRLPIIVWNTQELLAVDENFTTEAMIDNHGVHGTQDLCNVLGRHEVPFEYVTSHLSDEGATDEIVDFAFAAAAACKLDSARLGLIGYPFPGMGDFAMDTTHLAGTLGCEWLNIPLEEYITRTDASMDLAGDLVTAYKSEYDIAADVTDADLTVTAATELAMRGIVDDYSLDGLTYQFLAFGQDERTQTVPFVGISRMMGDGVGFGGEGDLIATAGALMLDTLATPASFCEAFTTDFAGNGLFMSHMGESSVAMARKDIPIKLVARSGPITKTRNRQCQLVTSYEPGPATFCALTLAAGQTWRLIVSHMEIADWGPLPAMEVPHYKLVAETDIRDWLTNYAQMGGPHHAGICFGDARNRLAMVADMLGADYVEI
jgi:L-arabinose isomerase